MDMVDPQPPLVEFLVRHVLLPREFLPQIGINSSVYRVRTHEQIRTRLALDMWREAHAEGRQQTLASLHRARAG
jgi:hypothetical protein